MCLAPTSGLAALVPAGQLPRVRWAWERERGSVGWWGRHKMGSQVTCGLPQARDFPMSM